MSYPTGTKCVVIKRPLLPRGMRWAATSPQVGDVVIVTGRVVYSPVLRVMPSESKFVLDGECQAICWSDRNGQARNERGWVWPVTCMVPLEDPDKMDLYFERERVFETKPT